MTVDLTGVTCNKVNYLCNKFKLDKPTPKFLLTKASPTADVGCAPVKCKGVSHSLAIFINLANIAVELLFNI